MIRPTFKWIESSFRSSEQRIDCSEDRLEPWRNFWIDRRNRFEPSRNFWIDRRNRFEPSRNSSIARRIISNLGRTFRLVGGFFSKLGGTLGLLGVSFRTSEELSDCSEFLFEPRRNFGIARRIVSNLGGTLGLLGGSFRTLEERFDWSNGRFLPFLVDSTDKSAKKGLASRKNHRYASAQTLMMPKNLTNRRTTYDARETQFHGLCPFRASGRTAPARQRLA
jgi:hypothetical protein